MSNDYLNLANSQIKDTSKWLKDYKANPEKYGSATAQNNSSSTGSNSSADLSQLQQLLGGNSSNNMMMGMFQSMMMLMMFQILSQQMGVKNTGNALDLSNLPSGYNPVKTGNCNTNGGNTTSNDKSNGSSSSASNQAMVSTMLDALKSTDSPTEADLETLIDNWQDKEYTETQFGQTVMYLLHQGSASEAESLQDWLPSLFQSGALNPNPLLSGDYLSKLPDDRLAMLSDSIASTGLQYADNSNNTSLIGSLLRSIGEGSLASSDETTMSQDILYRLWENDPDDAVLANVLSLAGFKKIDDGGLEGPFTLSSQYTATTV